MSDVCCRTETPARPIVPGEEIETAPKWWRDPTLLPSAISGLFLIVGFALGLAGQTLLATVLESIALLAGAWTFVPGALRGAVRGKVGVGLLMTIAAVGAVALGHVAEAAALAFLFSLAEALEDRAMDRAKAGLRELLSLVPQTARVVHGDEVHTVPAADLREDDRLIIGAGERIATDGLILEGRSHIDASAVTGEAIPVAVAEGDEVTAGTVNGSGSLVVKATADGCDNSLTQIVALVEQAHARKGSRARLADRIARPLVPISLIAAALVAAFGFIVGDPWTWVERALIVLVAASPCALAIAVPVTVISAIGSASKLGVVIKSGAAFEQFGTVGQVAFDKTGTLTQGHPKVAEVRTAANTTQAQVLAWAAAVEATSTHPLAAAIVEAVPAAPAATGISEDAGHGIRGTVGGTDVRVGSPRWIDPSSLSAAAEELAEAGMTVVVVEADGTIVGLIGVRDELRPEAKETISILAENGVDTIMLTGDNRRTALALAAEAGIDQVRAEQLPTDKADAIAGLNDQQPTAMVGDGINDAPALATATVGIAMGATGSAAAVESADIALTGHDLRLIPAALLHARRGRRIMTVNIALSLATVLALFPIAIFGLLNLAGVVLVHELVEIVVILNGVRAARLGTKHLGVVPQ
ncbi:cation-translocating P-type ATPase [Brevibacterium sp. HMSC063G07]|uniref:heavy metal translocating P-type ATPase n=1 Tax=Brevibacterium sp. HMSC063G07 TaxID=1739261 RepID=UPI0008A63D30|nr:cation-translocating P-type ATPase [Brevibacterium sp. HMSC063G07]OFL67392.1 ATPase P [Brevibacterium sp. HMSC063G07]